MKAGVLWRALEGSRTDDLISGKEGLKGYPGETTPVRMWSMREGTRLRQKVWGGGYQSSSGKRGGWPGHWESYGCGYWQVRAPGIVGWGTPRQDLVTRSGAACEQGRAPFP